MGEEEVEESSSTCSSKEWRRIWALNILPKSESLHVVAFHLFSSCW